MDIKMHGKAKDVFRMIRMVTEARARGMDTMNRPADMDQEVWEQGCKVLESLKNVNVDINTEVRLVELKDREEVESLKSAWRRDPYWDLETTTGFEAYYDELKECRLQYEKEQLVKRNREHAEKAAKYCPFMAQNHSREHCLVEQCAVWDPDRDRCGMRAVY